MVDAIEELKKVLAIDPEDLTFNLNLGLFLALRDDPAAYQAMATRANPYGDGTASIKIVQQAQAA